MAITIQWHCSQTLGIKSTPWGDFENECETDFETEQNEDDWNDKDFDIVVKCPKCGADVSRDYDEPQILKKENN